MVSRRVELALSQNTSDQLHLVENRKLRPGPMTVHRPIGLPLDVHVSLVGSCQALAERVRQLVERLPSLMACE